MSLTDTQRKLLSDTKGWLNNARLDCQKFEYRPDRDADDMLSLGVEIEEIGAALIRAAEPPERKPTAGVDTVG